ncbi:MAG: OsmC family protein [Candidatus Promineifilaceae bacterium]
MRKSNGSFSILITLAVILLAALALSGCQALAPYNEAHAETEAPIVMQSEEVAVPVEEIADEEMAEPQPEVTSSDDATDANEVSLAPAGSTVWAKEYIQPESMAEVAMAESVTEETAAQDDAPALATASASAKLTNQPGRAIVSARGNHFIVDSVPPIEGPNEEINPLDMILGAQATCALFIAERVGQEEAIPLQDIRVAVEADLDVSGVAGSGADPRLQAMRVHLELPGADDDQIASIVSNFTSRCPVYTTLSRATDIEITVGDEAPSAATEGLNTASVAAQLSNQPGRAIVSARGNHFVIDSVPPLEGPNEERNPLDLMLGSLATCGTFIFERSAQEMDVPIAGITTYVEGDLDPRGLASQDSGINPRLQAFRVTVETEGIDEAQGAEMLEQYKQRCPIYTTLQLAAPIEVSVVTN